MAWRCLAWGAGRLPSGHCLTVTRHCPAAGPGPASLSRLSVPIYAIGKFGTLSCSTLNFAFAISEMQSTYSTHKVQYDQIPRRDTRRRQVILKTKLDHPSMENWEIAARADCMRDYVRSVLRKNPINPIQAAERASLAPLP